MAKALYQTKGLVQGFRGWCVISGRCRTHTMDAALGNYSSALGTWHCGQVMTVGQREQVLGVWTGGWRLLGVPLALR